jgi:6-phosphogluconolactonase (cycloisomerase 2 family)
MILNDGLRERHPERKGNALMRTVLYQGVGDRLTHWDVDVDAATLTPRGSITLPSSIQYVWPHPSRKHLYVTTSDAASGNVPNPGKVHRLCAVGVDATGALSLHGEPAALPQRPIHHSLDHSGAFALTCYNTPANLSVHRINADGTVGAPVQQPSGLDLGIYPHQILTMPANRSVIMPARGNRAEGQKAEDPGALKIYGFKDGSLSPLANLRVGGKGGYGYGPRHVDFHPTKPWAYVSVESQNEIHMHRVEGDSLSAEPLYKVRSTVGTQAPAVHQLAGGIHVHPDGRTVYLTNRASTTVDFNGKRVFLGGENNIAVFAIEPGTGEPKLIQNEDPQSFHVRTFSIDPSGKLMVAGSIEAMNVRDGDNIRHVPAALTVFRIGDGGRLTFVRKYDVEIGSKFQWWSGLVGLP